MSLNALKVIVSDHGMTESGNHGGSSFEETDSLAVFVDLGDHTLDHASATGNSANQVLYQLPQFILLWGVEPACLRDKQSQ